MYDEQRRQQKQQERVRGDVDMENAELLEASATPMSLEDCNFFTNVVDELRDGVDPYSRT